MIGTGTTRMPVAVTALVLGLMLTGCGDSPSPTPEPSSSFSATRTPSATSPGWASPIATPSPTATLTLTPSPANPPPGRVVGLWTQTGGGSGEVLLRWTQNPEADVVSYIVLRATTSGGPLTRIGAVSRAEVDEFEYVPFVDSTATVAYYRVQAVDSAGQHGPRSAEVCGASYGHSC